MVNYTEEQIEQIKQEAIQDEREKEFKIQQERDRIFQKFIVGFMLFIILGPFILFFLEQMFGHRILCWVPMAC